jgi:hypothetical protein
MKRPPGSVSEIALMAAIVTTMLYLPVGALLALFCFAMLGFRFTPS